MPQTPAGTKAAILELLVKEELNASELAERLGLSPTAVRQHLAPLHATGLVERRSVVSGPNRPTDLYRLSDEGRRTFPKRYGLLLGYLVEALESAYGAEAVTRVTADAARRFAEEAARRLRREPHDSWWDAFLAWLEERFAWQANATRGHGQRRIVVHHCPFQDVSRSHPTVCGTFFGTLIATLANVEGVTHEPGLSRPACCAFAIREPTG
jgi:predicted ArsR family transcriptional regulator